MTETYAWKNHDLAPDHVRVAGFDMTWFLVYPRVAVQLLDCILRGSFSTTPRSSIPTPPR